MSDRIATSLHLEGIGEVKVSAAWVSTAKGVYLGNPAFDEPLPPFPGGRRMLTENDGALIREALEKALRQALAEVTTERL